MQMSNLHLTINYLIDFSYLPSLKSLFIIIGCQAEYFLSILSRIKKYVSQRVYQVGWF